MQNINILYLCVIIIFDNYKICDKYKNKILELYFKRKVKVSIHDSFDKFGFCDE